MDIVKCVLKETFFFHVNGLKKKKKQKNKTKQNITKKPCY